MISDTCAISARGNPFLGASRCLLRFLSPIPLYGVESFAFFLILLANRFNSAYDLVLDTELCFGSRLTLLGVVENAPNCRDSQSWPQRS
jgi:hypothetical protein